MHFLLLLEYVDLIVMVIENDSGNKDLGLCSVHHNDRDKSDTVKREEARLALKT